MAEQDEAKQFRNENAVLAQRLREYIHSPHHTNPPSLACIKLVEEVADALGCAMPKPSDEFLNQVYWDFDARRKGYPPYAVPTGNEVAAFKAAFRTSDKESK